MNQTLNSEAQTIVVEEVFPHPPSVIWKALTSSALMSSWLMPPTGFQPVLGNRFTFQTKAAGEWDGTIHCEVLDVIENEKLSFAWAGGHKSNQGYGSELQTTVTFTLTQVKTGTRLSLVHSGFKLPTNDVAYRNMNDGWKVVIKRLNTVVDDAISTSVQH